MSYTRKEIVSIECICDFCKRPIDTDKPWIRAGFREIRDDDPDVFVGGLGAGTETVWDLHPACEAQMRGQKPDGVCVAFGCYEPAEYAQFCINCIKDPA